LKPLKVFNGPLWRQGRKGNSIKTRIETVCILRTTLRAFFHVEKAIPLKQGLKQPKIALPKGFVLVEKAIPLKQGLKHIL